MKNTLKRNKSGTIKLSLKHSLNNRFTKVQNAKSKNTKSKNTKATNTKSKNTKAKKTKRTRLFKFIPQKIVSRHPTLSKKRKNKRKKYISRNEVSPFRSIKERLKDYNSPLTIV